MTNQELARANYFGEYIAIATNNDGVLIVKQGHFDGPIHVRDAGNWRAAMDIPAADFVQLINMYRYIKEHNIRNDWINPNGKNEEA